MKQRGFSLLEMIGVIAIMAILAAALVPSITATLATADAEAEARNLSQLAEDLRLYVRREARIPTDATADWSTALTSVASSSSSAMANNRRGYGRVLLFHPDFFTVGGDTGGFGGYTQDTGLGAEPVSPRAMLVSNLRGAAGVSSLSASQFDAVWEQSGTPAVVESDQVLVERINFAPLFREVLINNGATAQAAYSLNGGSVSPIPASDGTTTGSTRVFVLDGTDVDVFGTPYPTGVRVGTFKALQDLSIQYGLDGATGTIDTGGSGDGDAS